MQQEIFMSESRNLLPFGGEVVLYPEFFEKEQADKLFEQLRDCLSWNQEPIWMFGKQVMQPRMTALYGNPDQPYSYSGISMEALPWTPLLYQIKEKIENFTGCQFTHVLCNLYRDGNDSMGWHRDNEAVLGRNPNIASVTFGVTRPFQLRDYQLKKTKIEVLLNHGSLLMMTGDSQHTWEHQLPKTRRINGPRVNLTFRKLLIK
ncbi:MAG: alpha-ketoglutarate-dependent dioxygenase AlkB [Algoriphagus sp.]|jgi:alkylated DNA repair dioxygenase AlkB|nr:alpha-ketoglutarate-dependent dioxygenase AlkB [Algoriphagus sp.]